MILWLRTHVELPDSEPWSFEAEVGHLLLTVEQSDDFREWTWLVEATNEDTTRCELMRGTCVSEYLAKSACRRAVVNLVSRVERDLRAPYRREA